MEFHFLFPEQKHYGFPLLIKNLKFLVDLTLIYNVDNENVLGIIWNEHADNLISSYNFHGNQRLVRKSESYHFRERIKQH